MSNLLRIEPIVEKLLLFLKGEHLTTLAIESGFVQRRPRKIDPKSFLIGLFLRVLQGTSSLTSLAMSMGLLKGIRISKQGVSKRLNESVIRYLERVLAHTIALKLQKVQKMIPSRFARILVQDSTVVHLPSKLAQVFPGNRNWTNQNFALVKIQAVYNILNEQFCWFWISPFSVNDQSIATTLFEYVQRGDLLIRDLGYFVFSAFTDLQERGAFFITRLKHGITVSDTERGKRIELLKTLKKYPFFDCWVIVGTKEHIKVRLIAIPVDPAVAAQRRRRLKRNRDYRLHPSKEHLALLGWNIFLLNVDAQILSPEDAAALYGMRWRIETIFKAWKSHFHLSSFSTTSALQVRISLYALFILVTLFHTFVLAPSTTLLLAQRHGSISLLKLSRYFKEQFWAVADFGIHQLHNHSYDMPRRAELSVLPRCSQLHEKVLIKITLHINVLLADVHIVYNLYRLL
jgi:hypothetical protein